MTLPTVLSILVEGHEDTSTAGFTRTLPSKTLNLAIRINRVILQRSQLFPTINTTLHKDTLLFMLMFDLLWRGVGLLLSLLGATFETEYQLHSCILRNTVIYQSVVISTADSGMERGLVYRLEYLNRRVVIQSREVVETQLGSQFWH